jgi:hypothetical protein
MIRCGTDGSRSVTYTVSVLINGQRSNTQPYNYEEIRRSPSFVSIDVINQAQVSTLVRARRHCCGFPVCLDPAFDRLFPANSCAVVSGKCSQRVW